jgi:hypothetical protein
MITLTVPEAGCDQLMIFPAAEAVDPMVTLLTSSRLSSKLRSKFNPATCAPSCDIRLTGTLMFASPGFPEPFPADITAVGVCAEASPMVTKRRIANKRDELSFIFMRIVLC